MTGARWAEIFHDFAVAKDHFTKSVQIFANGGFDDDGLAGYMARMALMHSVQLGYNAIEDGLLRILDLLGEGRPSGAQWQMVLLKRSVHRSPARPPILDPETARLAEQLRKFRDQAMHDANFNFGEVGSVVATAQKFADLIMLELQAFRSALGR